MNIQISNKWKIQENFLLNSISMHSLVEKVLLCWFCCLEDWVFWVSRTSISTKIKWKLILLHYFLRQLLNIVPHRCQYHNIPNLMKSLSIWIDRNSIEHFILICNQIRLIIYLFVYYSYCKIIFSTFVDFDIINM